LVAKVGERLRVSKQETQKLGVVRFNLRKISELEFRNKIRITFQKEFCSSGELKRNTGHAYGLERH